MSLHPVTVVQYTFTHKQYIEQHNRHKQYIERHNSLVKKSADRAPSFKVYPGICFTTEGKARKNLSGERKTEGNSWINVGNELKFWHMWYTLGTFYCAP